MMQKELNLTPDQTTKVRAIFAADRDKMMAVRKDSSLSQEDRRDKMMKMQQEQNEKIKAVLDDTQKPKFDAMQTRMRGRMQRGSEGGPPPAAPGADTAPPPPPPPPPPS
jgi:Spy/CpxP family protein refolding chaperone